MSYRALEIYVEEVDQWHGKPLYAAIIEQARKSGLAGATAFRGILGYGHAAKMHSMHMLDLAEDLPVLVKVIDEESKIHAFLEDSKEILARTRLFTYNVESL